MKRDMETRLLNGLCRALYTRAWRRFAAPCDPDAVQLCYLADLLQKNAKTVYGRKYDFEKIRSYDDFVSSVPLTRYEDYEPYIDRIAAGERSILTAEDVICLELTSGSSGGKKRIPYTKTLKAEFQRGIRPWLWDIYTALPQTLHGKSYWSITPVTAEKQVTAGGIPVGFEEDAAYFGTVLQWVMNRLFAVPGDVKFAADTEDFYFRTAKALLRCEDLALVSVWNPTFLTILCDFMVSHADALAGTLPPTRAEALLQTARDGDFTRVFPALQIISCWADGAAVDFVNGVSARFPGVYIQPKGLLATECFVSFPLVGETGSRLSLYSHFFEFRRLADGKIVTVGGLAPGEYEVIVTTGGGFCRYCIGDVIEVLAVYPDRPPRIRFLRRSGVSCDLCGEKLTEGFVRAVLHKIGADAGFSLLAPEGLGYCLYTTAAVSPAALDAALRESYHYDYCRALGQLRPAQVVRVAGDPAADYIRRLAAEGLRIGDIKPAVLSRRDGWGKWFRPQDQTQKG